MTEPLDSLLRAITHEIRQVEQVLAEQVPGFSLAVARIDEAAGTVVITGSELKRWGPRSLLEKRLTDCGLTHETWGPDVRIVVYPAAV